MNRDSVKETDQLFTKIASINPNGEVYLYIHNSSGKKWYFPKGDITEVRISAGMYHPMSTKGKLVKFLLIYFRKILLLTGAVNSIRLNACKELEKSISDIFEARKDDSRLTFFLGTPCEYQKIIIQVSQRKKILGYVKITDNERVENLFNKEFCFLEWLKKKGVNNVPRALHISSFLSDEIYLYAQSTVRDTEAKETKKLTNQAVSFLAEFNNKTMQFLSFEETEYYQKLCWILDNPNYISPYGGVVEKAITRVVDYYGNINAFCSCHGDFTSWNSFITKDGKLFAFDFEYALYTCPKGIDVFHWLISAQIFQGNMNAKSIYKKLLRDRSRINVLVDDFDAACLAHLLFQFINVCFRDMENISPETLQIITVWISMMKIILKED